MEQKPKPTVLGDLVLLDLFILGSIGYFVGAGKGILKNLRK